MAERLVTGEADASTSRLAALMAGLAVVVQNNVWRLMGDALPASVGEPLDALTALALSLQSTASEVAVQRSALLAAARLLGGESDAIREGRTTPHDDDNEQRAAVTDRLASDAAWARRLAH
jgi:hypothetical protein